MAPSILGLASAILGIPTITTFIQNLISALTRNSEYIENVQCTRNQLQEFEDEDLLGKMSILLTPTGYSDGSLNTIIPPYGFGSELIVNGDFASGTSPFQGYQCSLSNVNNTLVATATSANDSRVKQVMTTVTGKKYKITADLLSLSGSKVGVTDRNGNSFTYAGNVDERTTSGEFVLFFTAESTQTTVVFKMFGASIGESFSIDNVSVKEIEEADFDFSRGSSATRVNEQGLVEDVQILSGELVQNGNFAEEGSELVTNGNFDNWTADNPDSWTVLNEDANNYVTQDGTYARIVSDDTASIQIKQTIFTIGKIYKVELDAVVNSGNVEGLKLNDATAPATIGYVNSTGHHTFYFKAAGTAFVINRKGGGDTDISIDNVSVKEVGQNWTFGSSWSMGDGVAISDGGASYLTASGSSRFTSGKKYRVSLEIVEYNSGTVSLPFDGAGSNANYQNSAGVKTADIIVVNNNSPIYIYSSAFNGTIDNVSVKEVTDDTDLPRIDYSPYSGAGTCGHILLEPQRTNTFVYSEDYSQTNWSKSQITVSSNSIVSPDGSVNASLITITNVTPYLAQFQTLSTGTNYTMSAFVKKGTNRWVRLAYVSSSVTAAWFDLENNVVGTQSTNSISASIENYGNGWYRITNTFTAQQSSGNAFLGLSNGDNSTTATGVIGNTVYVWGLQVEQGDYATSYIPTSGSTVTRSAEVANNSGNADLFNDSEGVLYAEIAALNNNMLELPLNPSISISDGSLSNAMYIYFDRVNSKYAFAVFSGGSLVCNIKSDVVSFIQNAKIAAKFKQDDFALYVNGTEVATDTSGNTPSGLSSLQFDRGDGQADFYGKVKALAVFKEALSNNDLELLTGEGYNSFAALAAAYNYNVI